MDRLSITTALPSLFQIDLMIHLHMAMEACQVFRKSNSDLIIYPLCSRYTMDAKRCILSIYREDHTPSLTPSSEDDFGGNFLTLASLATRWTSCPSSNNVKSPPTYPLLQNLVHHPDSEPFHFQVRKERESIVNLHPFSCVFD